MAEVKISIVVRAYNEERHIGRLLDGINRQSLPENWEVETILVDSGSTDSTAYIAEHMGARVVKIAKEEFTFGRALNIGCDHATGKYLVIASAHVYPLYDDWLVKMVLPFENEQVFVVYGRQVGDDRTKYSEHQIFRKWFPDKSNFEQENPFCNNANCAIRKSDWKLLKYDEKITGLEDLAWAKKQMEIQRGYLVYDAMAIIVHVHEETYDKVKIRYMREAIAMKQIMPEMHFHRWDFFRLLSYGIVNDIFHAIYDGKLFSELVSIIKFRYAQFSGTYKGHNERGQISSELKNRFYYPKGLKKAGSFDSASRQDRLINYR